jgi:hypothetical protein
MRLEKIECSPTLNTERLSIVQREFLGLCLDIYNLLIRRERFHLSKEHRNRPRMDDLSLLESIT